MTKEIREKFKGPNIFIEYFEKYMGLMETLRSTYYSVPFGRNPFVNDELYSITFQKNSSTKAFGFAENEKEVRAVGISAVYEEEVQDVPTNENIARASEIAEAEMNMSEPKYPTRKKTSARKSTQGDNNNHNDDISVASPQKRGRPSRDLQITSTRNR